ncbi:hypothetical protein TNCT_510901 [Trichonephila clavata]|uniref:Uncharacterized protein n=1 Tax=Trichonephila clavata TaxID=2740835 RepID=A0A8X6LAT6_TRICU|nr:hypothetical protein TNCT_510901 [Trichonephila clavata]
MFTGEHASVKHVLDDSMTYLHPAEVGSPRRKVEEKSISLTNEVDKIDLEENLDENVENLVPSLKKDDKDTMNPIKMNVVEVTEALLKREESAHLIQKIAKGMNNECSDQEEAPLQLVPARLEILMKLNVDISLPAGNKYIKSDM